MTTRPKPRKSGLSQVSPLAPVEPQPGDGAAGVPAPSQSPRAAEVAQAAEVSQPGKQGQGRGYAAKDQARKDAETTDELLTKATELLDGVKVTTQRQSAYVTPYELNDARGAFLADWQNGGHDDQFVKWIGHALLTHALRTPEERKQLARVTARIRSDKRSGDSRSWNVPVSTIERMRKAIADDNAAGSWPTDSLWVGDAIVAATREAKERNGGSLPIPPRRLPNKLKRA